MVALRTSLSSFCLLKKMSMRDLRWRLQDDGTASDVDSSGAVFPAAEAAGEGSSRVESRQSRAAKRRRWPRAAAVAIPQASHVSKSSVSFTSMQIIRHMSKC